MTAITVRQRGTGFLLAMGPNNGHYDPGCDDATATKQIEPDYDVVVQEWMARAPRSASEKDQEGAGQLTHSPLLHALVLWGASRWGIPPAQARQELLTLYRSLVS